MSREKPPLIIDKEHPGKDFWEQIQTDEGMKYAFYRPPTELISTEGISFDTFQQGEETEQYRIVFKPLKRCPWKLPGEPKEPDTDIWEMIKGFVWAHLDVDDERLYDVLTGWILATWISEAWMTVPYLHILGPKNSGKTRLLEILAALCYRGMMSSNISESAIFRSVEKWSPTLLLDEAEIYSYKERSSIQNLLNSGYRRGNPAIRVRNVSGEELDLELFDTFGFKALAGTGTFKATLESRSILIQMAKNVRSVNFQLDEKQAKDIRSQLLWWRWRRLYDRVSEVSEVSEGYPEGPAKGLEFTDGRFAELYHPLITIANHGSKAILSYARDAYGIREDEEKTSIEAQILEKIIQAHPFLENGKFSTSYITETFNDRLNEREKIKSRSIGRIIKRLGLNPKRMTGGRAGWLWNRERITRLAKRYGLTPQITSLTSLTSLDEAQGNLEEA